MDSPSSKPTLNFRSFESFSTEQFETPEIEFKWPPDLAELNANITELSDDLSNPIPFSQLGPKDRDLNALFKKLKRAKDYSPKLHFAWLQAIDANSLGNAIHIHAQAGKTVKPNQKWTARRQNPHIDGYVRLQRGIYLHFTVDFRLSDKAQKPSGMASFLDPGTNNNENPIYRIKQRRRIRNNELHYFDHPKFGIISKVTPLEISEEIEELKIENTYNIE